MNVRFYQLQDTATLARLFTETVRSINATDYSPEQVVAWAPEPPDIEHWHRQFSRRITFVAEHDSEIIGFATLEPDGHLDHMYVHRISRGREWPLHYTAASNRRHFRVAFTASLPKPALRSVYSLNVLDFK